MFVNRIMYVCNMILLCVTYKSGRDWQLLPRRCYHILKVRKTVDCWARECNKHPPKLTAVLNSLATSNVSTNLDNCIYLFIFLVFYRSAVGARDVGADLLHGIVDVVLPHGVALGCQIRTVSAEDIGRVIAVVTAAVTFAIPRFFYVLKPFSFFLNECIEINL